MVYITLLLGLLIIVYCLVIFRKEDKKEDKSLDKASSLLDSSQEGERKDDNNNDDSFQKNLFLMQKTAVESSLLYELKEKVEGQLAELNQQKELVTHLMLRVEKKLEIQEETGFLRKKKQPSKEIRETRDVEKESLLDDSLERDRLYNDVYIMHDQGISLADIARQTGLGKGEVELIIGLRK